MEKGGATMKKRETYFGFIEYIENQNYSEETVISYEKVLHQFFSYYCFTHDLDHIDQVFLPHITPSDIKSYLNYSLEDREKSVSTVNKELAIIKTFFNYAWEHNKGATVDPAVKIKRFKNPITPEIELTYDEIIQLKHDVMNSNKCNSTRKSIFLLATKGLKSSEFRFKKTDVTIDQNDERVEINLRNRTIILEGEEAKTFLEYYFSTWLDGSDYVFTTNKYAEKDKVPIEVNSILNHLRSISKEFLPEKEFSLTLISIRRALIYHLYSNCVPIQQIAIQLGLQEHSVSNYIKMITAPNEERKTS